MQEYKLEIKQSVNYPRCRIYRDFVQNLIADTGIRVNGENLLFHYTVLCSYANFRTSYRRVCGITYTIYPGEWVCLLTDLKKNLRVHTRQQVLDVLDDLCRRRLIRYSLLGREKVIKFVGHCTSLSSALNSYLSVQVPC